MIRILLIALLLSGCAVYPYVEYVHLSDPRIDNDGSDLACGGGVAVKYGLQIDAGVCKNTAPNGGELVKVGVRYVWE